MKCQISHTKRSNDGDEFNSGVTELPTTEIAASETEAVELAIAALSRNLTDKGLLVEMHQGRLLAFCTPNTDLVEIYEDFAAMHVYVLLGGDGKFYDSPTPGAMGGYRRKKIYGRLDCPSALGHIAKGHYVAHRVFFADEQSAIEAGYRPCGICMKKEYALWNQQKEYLTKNR